ncbi:hypothetical protein [Comamonas aquatica]|uniref:Uncharacterized protein n=1 Tax=Comamonas aquatica TaxID=225991 RepID=A0AA42L5J8_9BURK|nr:hypothetical protein [Comamonas aquatica]MDH0362194.1 hypothetical protein [Comamonas aquatica]
MRTYEDTVTYLRALADGRELLNTKHLTILFGWSVRAQTRKRETGTLPFPFRQIGRLYFSTIYDVANFIFYGSQNTPKQAIEDQTSKLKPVAKGSRSTNADDFSHLFTFATFLERVTKEAAFLNRLQQGLEEYQREERKYDLTGKLIDKEEVKDKGRKRI